MLDADPLRGATRLLWIFGSNDRDRLAEVAHTVEGEHRLIGELEPVALLPWNVLVREHGVHAGNRWRVGEIDSTIRACACGLRGCGPRASRRRSRSLE